MEQVNKAPVRILLVCCCIYVLSFFNRLSPAVLAGDISLDLGMTSAQLGMFSGATMIAYGLMQLPSGLLADHWGGKKTLLLLLSMSGLCAMWLSLTPSIPQILTARFVMGLGAAVTVPCMVLLASYFPPHMYAKATGFLLCSGGIGSLMAASPLAFASEFFGWRVPILFSGLLTLALAVFIWFTVKEAPTEKKESQSKVSLKSVLSGIVEVLKNPRFWPLTLWLMCMPGIYFLFAGLWWGPYLVEGNGLDKISASYIISTSALTILIGQPFLGFLSDNILKRRKPLLILCALSTLVASLMMLFFTGSLSMPLLVLQGVLFIMGTNGAVIAFTMLKESFPPHMIGTAIGCANIFYPVWSAVLQNIFGVVLDWQLTQPNATQASAFSFTAYIYIFHCLVGLAMALCARETFQKMAR